MKPQNQHAPGLSSKVNGQIAKSARRLRKSIDKELGTRKQDRDE